MQRELAAEMEQAAEALEFEHAAAVRDRIRALTFVQGNDVVNPASLQDADVIAAWQIAGQTCVQVFFFRGGRNNGNRAFFPSHTKAEETRRGARRLHRPVLRRQAAAASRAAEPRDAGAGTDRRGARPEGRPQGRRSWSPSAARSAPWCSTPRLNAREALERKLAESAGQAKLLEGVAQLFALPAPPERIEVYDNSHIMGANPYGVMIVAGRDGFTKAAYRKFAIRGPITPGDDFAMMREVLERRFTRALKEQAEGAPPTDWPDLVLIDGGAGQLSAARQTLAGPRRRTT